MADNTQLNSGSGGDIISTDVITTLNGGAIVTGEKAQRVKTGWGVDGTFNDTNAANPLPVVQTGTPGLPTGAATAAKQPAIGTAGTASADVLTVQGKASMTPILTDASATTQPVSATSLPLPSGAATSANQTNGTQLTQITDAAGNARGVNVNASNRLTVSVDNTVTVASHAVTNAGTFAVQAAQSGTWTVQPGNTPNTTPWLVKDQAWSVSSQTNLTTAATVSAAGGAFSGGSFINLNSAPAYLQFFDTTGAVTLGTTTPTFVQPIPANATAANGAAFVFHIPGGLSLANGLKVAATTTATGATAVSTGLTGFITYK